MLQVGPPSLHYCAIVLRSTIVLLPVSHSSNHEYHCCQLTGQLSGVSNFYHTFKVFIWLTFIFVRMHPVLWNWKFQAVYYLHWFVVSWIVFTLSPESNKVNCKFVFWLFMCLASTSDSYINVHNFYWKKICIQHNSTRKKLFLWLGSVWPRVKFSIQFLLYQNVLYKIHHLLLKISR